MSQLLTILSPDQWRQHAAAEWLWRGYVAAGNITLLASQWKAGKTTLLSALLARMRQGGDLAGLPVKAGRAVVLSEEGPSLWQMRDEQFHFGDHVGLVCRPFKGKPSEHEWTETMEELAARRTATGLDMLVIDPLIAFLPGRNENSSTVVAEALLPLQRLTALGVAVLILHHTRKQVSADGKMARGSGALSGFADILMEMHWYRSPESGDRRRRIQAWSRYAETPRQLIVEWSEDGKDYLARGSRDDERFRTHWELLHAVLARADRKLTREQIRSHWPEGHKPPPPLSLWRWLNRAVAEGRVERDGTGSRYQPFRYWLKEKEEDVSFGSFGLRELPPLPGLE